MTHDCFDRMDKRLAECNGKIATGFVVTEAMDLRLVRLVATTKIDTKKRKSVPNVIMNYCPFCGVKLADVE